MVQMQYFLALVAEKRRNPADDVITRLCEAELPGEHGPQRLNDGEIATFALLLGAAGSETVTKLIGNGVVLFHRWPAEWAKVVGDPARFPRAVEEILRYWAPSQYQGRFPARTCRASSLPVAACTGAARRVTSVAHGHRLHPGGRALPRRGARLAGRARAEVGAARA